MHPEREGQAGMRTLPRGREGWRGCMLLRYAPAYRAISHGSVTIFRCLLSSGKHLLGAPRLPWRRCRRG